MAALTIMETIVLLLIEKGLMKAEDIGIALEDSMQVHREGATNGACELARASHLVVAQLIENMQRSSNLQAAVPSRRAE
jgi:hypothetical protein